MGIHSNLSPQLSEHNYHLNRAGNERRLARMAQCTAARDAHEGLAELHEIAARHYWREHVLLCTEHRKLRPIIVRQIEADAGMLHTAFG